MVEAMLQEVTQLEAREDTREVDMLATDTPVVDSHRAVPASVDRQAVVSEDRQEAASVELQAVASEDQVDSEVELPRPLSRSTCRFSF